ncbi:hypothetical protein MSUIS_05050 [Mycoplasma suis KI3806]|uniref:Uncharacterized protein n=1 Tax=Mycoplasma suis (strain KI_3806) TaxID=708248 RepID=F0V1R7_MYCS3|nr:hypothetical protein MSUIS_05050 [Mycoplasma suis KI3806]
MSSGGGITEKQKLSSLFKKHLEKQKLKLRLKLFLVFRSSIYAIFSFSKYYLEKECWIRFFSWISVI